MPSNIEEELFQIIGNVSKPWWEGIVGGQSRCLVLPTTEGVLKSKHVLGWSRIQKKHFKDSIAGI